MITFKEFLVESIQWKYGSGVVPKTYMESSPFPKYPALSKLRKTKYVWEDKAKTLYLVPVKQLYTWQLGVDSSKILPLNDPNYPPIKVNQIGNHLVIMNGNHRATSAYVQGLKYIKAYVANFDDEKAQKYWMNKNEFIHYPLSSEVIPYNPGKLFSK